MFFMINIFDCSSTENYLCEILEYAINAEKISVDARENSVWLATVVISDREHQIKIICPTAPDIQFGYKFVHVGINLLHSQGVNNIISKDFI
jgi:hypothetical protein